MLFPGAPPCSHYETGMVVVLISPEGLGRSLTSCEPIHTHGFRGIISLQLKACEPCKYRTVAKRSGQPQRCTGRQTRFARLPHGELPRRWAPKSEFMKRKHKVVGIGFLIILSLLVYPKGSFALQNALLNAQVRQLDAQAAYYRTQSDAWHIVISALSSALGALLGALIAFLSLRAQAKFQARREDERLEQAKIEEREKWERDQATARAREVRSATAELAKIIAMAANSMTWMLWIARHDKKRFLPKYIDEHDQYIKSLYSNIVAAQVALAAVDQQIYSESLQLVYKLYNIDAEIALCATRLPESIDELGNLWERSRIFEDEIPIVFSRIVNRGGEGVSDSHVVATAQSARTRPSPNPGPQADG